MTSQPQKLYRSNINFTPVTVLPPKDFNMTQDYQIDPKFIRQSSNKNTFASTGSQAHLKSKQLNQSIQITKQTMPSITIKDIQNTSFMSIDEAYLNPKFQKKKDFPMNRILPNNISDAQSDTESLGGRSIKTYQGQEEYYKYWKSKAHEYLEENFKLREENKRLKGEMQMMKQQVVRQLKSTEKEVQNSQTKQRENKSFLYLEGIFKKKLDELQNQLEEKTSKIMRLQDQVLELNRKLLGQEERAQLLQRLGSQIDTLSHENILLKMQIGNTQNQPQSKQLIEKVSGETGLRHRYRSKERVYASGRKSVEKVNRR